MRVAIFFSLLATIQCSHKEKPKETPITISAACIGYPAETQYRLRGELYLLKADDSVWSKEEAIREQLKFVRNNFKSGNLREDFLFWNADTDSVKIISINSKDSPYPLHIQVDVQLIKAEEAGSSYIISATSKSQKDLFGLPAEKIEYEVEFTATSCQATQTTKSQIQLVAPKDPYLAFWAVKPKERTHFSWGRESAQLPPCSDSEFADIPFPQYYWYYWDPNKEGSECLRQKKTLTNLSLKYISQSPFDNDIATHQQRLKNKLKTYVIFGWNDTQKNRRDDLNVLQQNLGKYKDSGILLRDLDKSSLDLLSFDRYVRDQFAGEMIKLSTFGDHLLATYKGIGKKKEVWFDVYWGPTDKLGKFPSKHDRFLTEAYAQGDVVVYSGHAGLGHNYRTELAPRGAPDKQIIALLGCYTYSYQLPDLPVSRRERYFVLTSSESSRMALDIKNVFSLALGENHQFDASQLDPNSFLVLKRQRAL